LIISSVSSSQTPGLKSKVSKMRNKLKIISDLFGFQQSDYGSQRS
jgi:hypothetical protein